ncbi:MAG: hypothetical protein ACLQDI_20570 [Syntrophobacteraceae bacterium]
MTEIVWEESEEAVRILGPSLDLSSGGQGFIWQKGLPGPFAG